MTRELWSLLPRGKCAVTRAGREVVAGALLGVALGEGLLALGVAVLLGLGVAPLLGPGVPVLLVSADNSMNAPVLLGAQGGGCMWMETNKYMR